MNTLVQELDKKDILKPAINDFVKKVDISFDYKNKSDFEKRG